MHETEGPDFVVESGSRLFIDQSLPGTPGTVYPAEWGNAAQEEIIHVIEYAGLTIEPTAAADRANGWEQMKTAIFESAAITDDAIDSIDLAKLFGEINITDIDTVTTSWVEDVFDCVRTQTAAGSIVDGSTLDPEKVEIAHSDPAGPDTLTAQVTKNGLACNTNESGDIHIAEYTDKGMRFGGVGTKMRFTVLDITSALRWTEPTTGIFNYEDTTSIPKTRNIYGFSLMGKTVSQTGEPGEPGVNYDGPQFRFNPVDNVGEKADIYKGIFSSVDNDANFRLSLYTERAELSSWSGTLNLLVWHD